MEEAVGFASLPSTGAVATFSGVTRTPGHAGKPVASLEFEAYGPMAESSLRSIAGEATNKFQLSRVVIAHRLGVVPLGETSLMIAVSSPHRLDALNALPWIVDSVKARAAIWKKEVYSDSSPHYWVNSCCAPYTK